MALSLKGLLGEQYKDGMTLEEIESALSGIDAPENESQRKEIERLTQALSKSNSEAAENKRKLREKQSEEEQQKEERDRMLKELNDEVKLLREEKAIASHKAQYLSLGYDDALASESAQALVKGEMDKVFACQKKYHELYAQNLKKELMKKTPTPPAGDEGGEITKEKFAKLGYEERLKIYNDNPTLYAELTKES